MSHLSLISQRVQLKGAAFVARELGVSRVALLSYTANACREATRIMVEQRAAERLAEPAPGRAGA